MERLDKILATRANLTRKEAREAVRSGLCTVGGVSVRDPGTPVPDSAAVTLRGETVSGARHVFVMLNKPKGYVSATEDPGPTVLDLVPEPMRRKGMFPAGRLDKDSEGFVLLTDDGETAHRLLSPRSHVPKTYEVDVDAPLDEADVAAFAAGIRIGDDVTMAAELTILAPNRARVVLRQGLYHQIKRMFAGRGKHVVRLFRTQIGGLPLDPGLAPGECRFLSEKEFCLLFGRNE